jgi:hypothetical protein
VQKTSDPDDTTKPTPIAWLLLRDGHAIPISGLSLDEIKAARRRAVQAPETELRHRKGLDAIVHTLGFEGDFGTYSNEGWPRVQRFLEHHHCGERRDLFPTNGGATAPFFFGSSLGPHRRDLADRIFVSGLPRPRRVFLGVGIDWREWDDLARGPKALHFLYAKHSTDPVEFLIANRFDLLMQWGFLDNKLVAGELDAIVNKRYHAIPQSKAELDALAAHVLAVARAFRTVFPESGSGWVDVLELEGNDELIFLRAQDGSWDLVWRDLRAAPPPAIGKAPTQYTLHPSDLPASLTGEQDVARRLYFRRHAWDERERYLAEQHFYEIGNSVEQRQMATGEQVLERYLLDTRALPVRARSRRVGAPPPGFKEVRVGDRTLLISHLISVGEFRAMLDDEGYLDRRDADSEDWHRANGEAAASDPVGASWNDAQAFCAWKERHLGVQLRLPTAAELRAVRPFHSEHYAQLAMHDFPWERWPPRPLGGHGDGGQDDGRIAVPSAVRWSEPRFHEPGPDRPEFPDPSGWTSSAHPDGRKRWIEDFPPRATWTDTAWAEHAGLRFIDAWDAYEWAQEQGFISGRFWEGHIGPQSWGAYKNAKVGFRLVVVP